MVTKLIDQILAEIDAVLEPELCDHTGDTVTRVAHGYLGDLPRGIVEVMCADCGAVQ